MTADITRHRAGQATRAPRRSGRHRPGPTQHPGGRRQIAQPVPADWTPGKPTAGIASVDTAVLYLPPDLDLSEVTP